MDAERGPGGRNPVENVLHERTATLQALLQGVRDYAIYTLDLEGRISSWHRGAELLLGYPAEEAMGMSFAALFPPEDRASGLPQHELAVARQTGEFAGEGWRLRRDGSRVEVAVVLTALRGPRGELLGFLKLTQDITARRAEARAAEEALHAAERARAEAEKASQSKGEFLGTLSHELRTPLSAILGWAQVLERGVLDTQTLRHGLEAISRNARQQVRLVEDLLDMTRIESGQLRLDLQRIELDGVVAAAVEAALPAAASRGLTLNTRFGPGVVPVLGDEERLQQAVGNLLANALKFTPRGGRIDVTLERHGGDAVVTVADTGQGIAPEFLPRVFERFQQQDGSTTRRHGGLGIGLAIVRQLMLMHGGSVQAHSAGTGQGASFSLRVPTLPSEPVTVPGALLPPPEPAESLAGLSVLLVDDEPDVRTIAACVLRAAGAQVMVAATADEGLQLLQARLPSVLLSDIGMPGRDGYDFMRAVRALPEAAGGRVPAAAFTAFAGEDDRERAFAAGFQAHLAKPVAADDLVAAVARLATSPLAFS